MRESGSIENCILMLLSLNFYVYYTYLQIPFYLNTSFGQWASNKTLLQYSQMQNGESTIYNLHVVENIHGNVFKAPTLHLTKPVDCNHDIVFPNAKDGIHNYPWSLNSIPYVWTPSFWGTR